MGSLNRWKYGAFVVPFLFLIIYLAISSFHALFEEWDGVIQFFQGKELLSGEGYKNWGTHYWPPLYSILIGLVSQFSNGFFASKFVSIISSFITLSVVYYLVMELTDNEWFAFFAQVLVGINPYYLISSVQAENHILSTLFFVSTFLFLFKIVKRPDVKLNIAFLACFSALATLSRYTSYALVPLVFIVFIFFSGKKYLFQNIIIYSGVFVLINSPWYCYNYSVNGSILHTWQYLNIGTGVYPGGEWEWQWSAQKDFYTIGQIFNKFPHEYLANFFHNFVDGFIHLFRVTKFVFLIAFILVIANWRTVSSRSLKPIFLNKHVAITLVGFFGFLVLVSQAFVFTEVFLSWNVIFTVIILALAIKITGITKLKHQHLVALYILLVLNIGYSGLHIYHYLNNRDDSGQLTDNAQVTAVLKSQKNIEDSYIMSVHPARAYYANSGWIYLPDYFNGTIDQIVNYGGLPEKVKSTQPKYPNLRNEDIHADYLVYDNYSRMMLPQFEFLFSENSAKIPTNFKLLYKSGDAVVYKIER